MIIKLRFFSILVLSIVSFLLSLIIEKGLNFLRNMQIIYSLLFLVALLSSGCSNGKEQTTPQEIVIASANPMSGNSSDFGDMKVKAIQLAFDEVNHTGGIDGKKLTLQIGDDESSPKEAYKLAVTLATDPKIVAVIGHFNSASTLAARNVYNGAGIPVITDSVNKAITDGTTPYLFRILATDQFAAEQLAEYTVQKLHHKKIAIIYVNNDYSKDMKEYFRKKIRQLGGEITTMEIFFEERTKNFNLELERIKATKPDAIFFVGYYKEAALIARQARFIGLTAPIISTDGISSLELIHLGGEAVEGIRFNGSFHPSIVKNGSDKFAKDFKARYGKEPDTYAALAYDSAQILIEGIRKNGASRENLYTYLSNLKDYPGVTGNITFDDKHQVQAKIIILTVKNGQFVPDTLQPE